MASLSVRPTSGVLFPVISVNNIRKALGFLLGGAAWFPSFALVVVRNNGLQVAPVLAAILLLLVAVDLKNLRFSKNLLVVTIFWLMVLAVSTLFSPHRDQALRGSFLLLSGFLVLHAAYFLGRHEGGRDSFFSGYTVGGVFSSLYAGYQLLAFSIGWPGGTLFNNNPSFPSYAQSSWLEGVGRAFAFTPEPSVLSSLLIPLILVHYAKYILEEKKIKNLFVLAVCFFGLISSSSLAIMVTLPLSFFCFIIINKKLKLNIMNYKKVIVFVCLLLVFAFLTSVYTNIDWQVAKRFQGGLAMLVEGETLEAGSVLIRFFSGLAAIQLFFERPVFGWGLFATSPEFEDKLPSLFAVFEEKTGVDSWFLGFAMWQGLAGLLVFGFLLYLALKATKKELPLQAAFIGVVITIFFQTGYILLYHVWAFLGLALASQHLSKQDLFHTVSDTELNKQREKL